ncbi:MAG: four helix bundle protein [Nitrospirae bacterium]|nr:four helix bundle protein [Nitrospirota bacterium]
MPRSFEELDVWQKSLQLVKEVYRLSSSDKFIKDYSLADKISRAAVSVMSNIAEGFERGSNTEFIQFLYISKGSCGEVRSQIYIARELGYLPDKDFQSCAAMCREVSAQLSGFISYLKGSNLKGEKFRTAYKSRAEEMEEFLKEFKNQNSKFKKD